MALCVLAVGIAGIGHGLSAQEPTPEWPWSINVLDEIALDYKNAFGAWVGQILTVATNLFFWLALLEFVIAGIMYTLATPQAREGTVGRFLIKIMLISFVFMLMTESNNWILPLINSFAGVGQQVTGQILSPSEIVAFGTRLSADMMEAMGMRQVMMNPLMAFYNALAAFGVFLSYVLIAAQVVLTLVDCIDET